MILVETFNPLARCVHGIENWTKCPKFLSTDSGQFRHALSQMDDVLLLQLNMNNFKITLINKLLLFQNINFNLHCIICLAQKITGKVLSTFSPGHCF